MACVGSSLSVSWPCVGSSLTFARVELNWLHAVCRLFLIVLSCVRYNLVSVLFRFG